MVQRPSPQTIDSLLRSSFDEEQAPKVLALFKAADPYELLETMGKVEAEGLEKRRDHRRLTPRLDNDNPLLESRQRLPVTGMTLSAQAVTGQPHNVFKSISSGVTSMNMIDLAKAAADAGTSGGISRADWYGVIAKLADASRRANESSQQAFVRFTESDPDGQILYRAYKLSDGPDYSPAAPMAKAETKPVSQAMQRLKKIAAELRKAHPELTEAQAFTKVYEDPADVELRQESRQYDLSLSLAALYGR